MDKGSLCCHSPLHMRLVSVICLWKESNQCGDLEFGDPSRGKELGKSTLGIQELPVCHLTEQKKEGIRSWSVLFCILERLKKSCDMFTNTFKSMESTNQGYVFPHSSIRPNIPHITHNTMFPIKDDQTHNIVCKKKKKKRPFEMSHGRVQSLRL